MWIGNWNQLDYQKYIGLPFSSFGCLVALTQALNDLTRFGYQWLRVTAAIPMKLANAPETVGGWVGWVRRVRYREV